MQKDKTDKSLVIDIQFFLKFGFVLLEGNKYCYTHTHTHTHTHKTKPRKPTRRQNGVYQTPAEANQLLSRGN